MCAGLLRADGDEAADAVPESESVSDAVSFPVAGTMIIEGYRYRAPAGIPVQIGGVTGTVADLLPGMQVQFRFLRIPNDLRELVEVREIPASVTLQRL